MCTEYCGGLTYRDGCRKRGLGKPWIVCKARPVGKDGAPGDGRKCKNYLFVDFGFHRIWGLACPEHAEVSRFEMIAVCEEELRGVWQALGSSDDEEEVEEVMNSYYVSKDSLRSDRAASKTSFEIESDEHSRTMSTGSKAVSKISFASDSASHSRTLSTESSDGGQLHSEGNLHQSDPSGTWPTAGTKPGGRFRYGRRNRRKSLSSLKPMHSIPSIKNLLPIRSTPDINADDNDRRRNETHKQTLDEKSAYARFITRLPPGPFKDQGRANRPRSHTRNKSAQVLGLEDPVVEEISREVAVLNGLGLGVFVDGGFGGR